MALSSLKKKLAINSQALSEKFSKTKSETISEEYLQLTAATNCYKRYLEDVQKSVPDFIEPGQFKLRPPVTSGGSHHAPTRDLSNCPEWTLGRCLEKHAKHFDSSSSIGSALQVVADKMTQLAEARCRANEEVYERFLQPISETLNQDLKEITQLCKKANHRRLGYEVERGKVQKSKSLPNNSDYMEAESKYVESHEASEAAMMNFLETEPDHVELLSNFISAQLRLAEECQLTLRDLDNKLKDMVKAARASTGTRAARLVPKHLVGEFQDSDNDEKLKNNTGQTVPCCQVLFDFESTSEFELELHKGDFVKLIEQVDESWYLGEIDGREGHFPITYVKVIVPLP